jgi:diguanylate cyclase (GGDEF)-like protein/PAS domain S-box-containing protein
MNVLITQRQTSHNPTVLIVDDDPGTRFLVTESLQPHGFDIKEAASGEQALTLYPSVKPDAILLDVNMPGIDGFETCLKIRNSYAGQYVPILIITGRDDSATIDAAYAAGASDFIVKPINWPILVHHVRYMLRAGQALSEQHQNILLQILIHHLSELASQFFLSLEEMLNAALRIIVGSDYFTGENPQAAIFLVKDDKLILAASSKQHHTIHLDIDAYADISAQAIDAQGQLLFPLCSLYGRASATGRTALNDYNSCTLDNCANYAECKKNSRHGSFGVLVIKLDNLQAPLGKNPNLFTPVIEQLSHLISYTQAQLELHLTAQVFENSLEGIAITGPDTAILRVNRAFEKITGYTAEEAFNKRMSILKSGQHNAAFYADMWRSIHQKEQWQGEIWNRRKNGDIFPAWLSISAIKNAKNQVMHYMGVFVDISQQKEQEQQLEQVTRFDSLTGLANQSLFDQHARQALAEARENRTALAVLYIDLDRFKYINESFGHAYGDQLLIIIARRIQACLRKSDTVARQSGDEFIILLPDLAATALGAQQQASDIAKNILDAIHHPLNLNQHELFASASIGIALFPQHATSIDDLIKHADTALYSAKEKGKNRYQFYSPTLSSHGVKHFTLESALYKAIDNNEFSLHYQPQINIDSNLPIGAESLIRWYNPQLGHISPMAFIPLAEETGYIKEIGDWVIQTACRQLKTWETSGFFNRTALRYVAVNVSPQQFMQSAFVPTIKNIIDANGLSDASRLELELTESCFMRNSEESIQTLVQLRELGVRLSIDDFGTGYSSLAYLKDFPLHTLKIDQSFIKNCTDNASNAAIVRAIIAMAAGLGLNTIAEGVETIEQLQFLRQNICMYYQGYYKSKPLPLGDFEALIAQHSNGS